MGEIVTFDFTLLIVCECVFLTKMIFVEKLRKSEHTSRLTDPPEKSIEIKRDPSTNVQGGVWPDDF